MIPPAPRPHARSHGFTIVELLVVVFILLVLISVSVVLGKQMQGRAMISHAKSIVQAVHNAAAEYKIQVGEGVDTAGSKTHTWNSRPKNAPEKTTINASVSASSERFVSAGLDIPSVAKIIYSLGPETLRDEDVNSFFEIRDPWGYTLEIRSTNNGKFNVSNDRSLSLPYTSGIVVGSRGPDRQFGKYYVNSDWDTTPAPTNPASYSAYAGSSDYKQTLDNIVSTDLK